MSKKKKSDKEKKAELLKEGTVLSANYTHSRKTRQIIEWFREGLTDKEIFIRILQENPNVKESSAQVYFNSAKASFREEFILDRKFNIIQHVKRYDKDILILSKHEPRTSSFYKYQEEKSQAYLDMIALLQKKEKVLGFHRKTTQLKIKNNVNLNLKTRKTFDLSSLSWEDKLELYNLINKAQVNENEKLVLTPNKEKQLDDKAEVVDIEHEEVIEELNIDKIQEKEEELKLFDEVEEVGFEKDKNVIDTTKQDKEKGKDLNQIKSLLLGNLLK